MLKHAVPFFTLPPAAIRRENSSPTKILTKPEILSMVKNQDWMIYLAGKNIEATRMGLDDHAMLAETLPTLYRAGKVKVQQAPLAALVREALQ